ncbi:MAG: hypothetical protein COA58_16875 [Bacteroidetes bacterium]|nr:MAG: hypothetical protein COA58_16875 [Bacteroidota bacterium]
MNLEKMMILQQSELGFVNQQNYFDQYSPCHLYFVCKRPRLTINPDHFEIDKKTISIKIRVQYESEIKEHELKFYNNLGTTDAKLITKYPYGKFQIVTKKGVWCDAKVSPFVQNYDLKINSDFLDMEVLYIGQSYGVDGARTAPDRLKNHSTLQGIYSEAITNNTDSEIWLALASFEQVNIMMMDGRTKFSEKELEDDKSRMIEVSDRLNWEGINEQQKINFTEASLIKYFQPPYNKIYKDTFPNPAHKTYSECYELDINSICIEMHTSEMINCRMYSDAVEKSHSHYKTFLLHSTEERKSMFQIP